MLCACRERTQTRRSSCPTVTRFWLIQGSPGNALSDRHPYKGEPPYDCSSIRTPRRWPEPAARSVPQRTGEGLSEQDG